MGVVKVDRVIDQLCDEFEQAWQQGSPIPIESLLQRSDAEGRDGLLGELVRLEVGLRQSAGEQPSSAEYLARFPEKRSVVESALGNRSAVEVTMDLDRNEPEVTTDFSADSPTRSDSTRGSSGNDPSLRQSIGRYTIVGTLGRGGQADVFRGIHPTLPIEVAIKLTHETLSEKAREALKEEAHILCDLDHPHIARVRDFDFDDGRPFMVLDYIRGRSLGQIAESQPPSPTQAAELVAKLARAIGYAHARGVLHRDLKPDNVVIDESGQPKIIDFGMSRMRSGIAGAVNEADEVSGTLAYMSPEQAAGITSKTDHRVDVFALGAILYRLLVGKSPYPSMAVRQLIERVRQGEYDVASLDAADVPDELKTICRRAMHRDPAERFLTAEALAEALDQVTVAGTPLPSTPSPSRVPSLTTVAGLVGLVVILAGGWFLSRPEPSVAVASNVISPNPSNDLIQDFELTHIGNSAERAEFSGSLLQFRAPRENDDIQVKAEFTSPVYCFLVALNPDGVKQLCYPANAATKQAEPITSLRYPTEENAAFGLTDGIGQQAFVLFTSREPLPAFSEWESDLSSTAWPNPDVVGNWSYTGGELVALTNPNIPQRSDRGTVRTTKTPTPFKELCDRLRKSETTDVRGVLFEVKSEN